MSDYSNKPKATGNLFQNGYKTKQNHPDYKSTITINAELLKEMVNAIKVDKRRERGVDINITMWERDSKNLNKNPVTGESEYKKYFYTSIEVDEYALKNNSAEQQATDSVVAEASVKGETFDEEDIPF